MLEYEWGNPSPIMFTGDENPPDTGLNRQILDPYGTHNFNEPSSVAFINPNAQFDTTQEEHNHHHHNNNNHNHNHHNHHNHHQQQPFIGSHHFHHSIYDTLAVFGAESSYTQGSLHSLEPSGSTGYMVIPKSEPLVDFNNAGGARIGLNLGGRTYFASSEDDFVSRLYRRSRISEPGSVNSPRCQAEGCNADLSNSKHYHRRHKVCEFHSKAATVITAGLTQRFCQQCSRFHLLTEFDNGKRSCRKRLADHNRRRRKSQQPLPPPPPPSQQHSNKSLRDNASNSASKDIARSTPESGAHSSSSMASAVSRQKVSFDRFKQKSYQVGSNSSASAKIVSNWD